MTKYVPKHRLAKHRAPTRVRLVAPGAIRQVAVLGSVAAATTGATIGAGLWHSPEQGTAELSAVAAQVQLTQPGPAVVTERAEPVSRSGRRAADPGKEALLAPATAPGLTRTEDLSDADPRTIAKALLPEYGFAASEFECLDPLYMGESGWRVDADNPYSSAYGIPQALTSLHELPEGYMTSAEVQIRWGLEYIARVYGTPCNAWGFKQGHGWY